MRGIFASSLLLAPAMGYLSDALSDENKFLSERSVGLLKSTYGAVKTAVKGKVAPVPGSAELYQCPEGPEDENPRGTGTERSRWLWVGRNTAHKLKSFLQGDPCGPGGEGAIDWDAPGVDARGMSERINGMVDHQYSVMKRNPDIVMQPEEKARHQQNVAIIKDYVVKDAAIKDDVLRPGGDQCLRLQNAITWFTELDIRYDELMKNDFVS